MAGYVRNDTTNNIADGNIVNAADLDGEFDAIVAAFVNTTGHTHDGTAAEGAPITKIGPTQDVVASATSLTPKTTDTIDLGSNSLKFKDIYNSGTAYLTTLDLTNALPVSDGGTSLNTLTANNVILGNGTSAPLFVAPGSSGNVLTSNGTTWTSAILPAGGLTYVLKTANYTTQDKEGVLADTSGGAFTVTLPATPALGNQVVVADPTGDWGTNNLTVGRNGSTIAGVAQDLVCDISGASVQLVYDGTTWAVYAQVGGNGGTVVTLDDTQTLTNKTIEAGTFTNGYTEEVYTLGTSGTLALNPVNGSIQSCAAAGTVTFTDSLAAGQSLILMLTGGDAQTINWPTVTWVTAAGNAAPTLTASDALVFWKISTTLYAAYVGSGA